MFKRYGVSQDAYKHISKYGGMGPSDAKKLQLLEAEIAMLRNVNSKKVVTTEAKRKTWPRITEFIV
ncbi:hypothetical protein [Ruegeria atlantica]|uniref:Transposase n=1 Tax=Ruegeria atlantica TaxID=81569 RepID=A0A0P1F2A4_9RHOB|nr:hypothetical protein [Ruegeria atlantica]CUH48933.1 hypothetical protein RUA4292_03124 [Ruegeria atlantica]